MVIGFSGRMRSGKTELARICERKGYKRLSFATPLKALCARILSVNMEGLNKMKNENFHLGLTFSKPLITMISKETNIPIDVVEDKCGDKTIEDVRDLLQFIGTDLIREYNADWHVNKVKDMMEQGTDYVFDDVRFQNEKKMIESIGGDVWFVIRTQVEEMSNHPSETAISWQDCYNKVIINNSSLDYLIFKWETFMEDYSLSCKMREKLFESIVSGFGSIRDDDMSAVDMLFISKSLFDYYERKPSSEIIRYEVKNGLLTVQYIDNTFEVYSNPLQIEDIKIYLPYDKN